MNEPQARCESRPFVPWFRRGRLPALREDLGDLFADLFDAGEEGWLGWKYTPSLDVVETDSTIEIEMDLPGFKPEEVDIRLSGQTLTISGKRSEREEESGRTYHRVERRTGSFSRSVHLPSSVVDDQVDAQYRDGVLVISLPKVEKAKVHKIEVRCEEPE